MNFRYPLEWRLLLGGVGHLADPPPRWEGIAPGSPYEARQSASQLNAEARRRQAEADELHATHMRALDELTAAVKSRGPVRAAAPPEDPHGWRRAMRAAGGAR